MSQFQPPPTYADPVTVSEKPNPETGKVQSSGQFSPIWLKWFLDLAQVLSSSGAGTGTIQHNSLGGLQGGTTTEQYHLTNAQHLGLVSGSNTALHYHAADRDSANFTGANWTSLTSGGDSTLHYHTSDRNRANHTGTQTLSTISDAGTAAGQSGLSTTITTAKLTTLGANGSMTFTNGVLTASTPAT